MLRSAKAGVKDISLKYDAGVLRYSAEKIELNDEGMRRSWGPALYRVQLKTVSDVAKGAGALRSRKGRPAMAGIPKWESVKNKSGKSGVFFEPEK